MSLISVSWTLYKSPGVWDKFDLDSIIDKGYLLFRFNDKFRYLGIEELPQEPLTENRHINMQFLENKKRNIISGTFLLSILEIRNSVRQIVTCALYIFLILMAKMRMATY